MLDVKELSARSLAAFNAHDTDALAALDDPSVVITFPSPTGRSQARGREGSKAYNLSWFKAFPDAKITITNEVITGDHIVQEGTFQGTNTGTWTSEVTDMPATGKSLKGEYCLILKVREGLIVSSNLYFDQVQVLTQLGLMRAPATASV
jgi:predicted ester cyclase